MSEGIKIYKTQDKNIATKIAIFKGKEIRKTIHNNEWWFSVIDIIEALTGTERPRKYWNDLKKKLAGEGYFEVSENIGQLKLTAEISKSTFDMTPGEYKKFKNLKRENLRDHMNDLELIFTMLGERATTEITRTENSRGVPKLKKDAREGGAIAGGAKKKLEKRIGKPISSKENYLKKPQDKKLFKKSI